MTVTYSRQVATTGYWTFFRLLLRWRGSVYKLIWFEFFLFCLSYAALSLIYNSALTDSQKKLFEIICLHCEKRSSFIPVVFVLGFFISMIVHRWWQQLMTIPWPDQIAIFLSSFIYGFSDDVYKLRRQIMRHLNLSYVMCMRSICAPVKKRFPTDDYLVTAGLMTEDELRDFNSIETPYNKFYVPIAWAANTAAKARRDGMIKQDPQINILMNSIMAFRDRLNKMFWYDWINPPLVYVQVATISVHTFFLSLLFGRQFLDPEAGYKSNKINIYVPFFTLCQFVFYMGWLKVGEALVNPFGEDDDDFDVNFIIERNIQLSYMIVHGIHINLPEMVSDAYWDNPIVQLPNIPDISQHITKPGIKRNIFDGSVSNLEISKSKLSLVSSSTLATSRTSIYSDLNRSRRQSSFRGRHVDNNPALPKTSTPMSRFKITNPLTASSPLDDVIEGDSEFMIFDGNTPKSGLSESTSKIETSIQDSPRLSPVQKALSANVDQEAATNSKEESPKIMEDSASRTRANTSDSTYSLLY